MKKIKYLFTSESVTDGHPDKVCDQISDAILDAHLAQDPNARVAAETAIYNSSVIVGGEITSLANVDHEKVTRKTIEDIGYTDPKTDFSDQNCSINIALNTQSPDIAMGVNQSEDHEQGAGDQGLMFGYACKETPELMPLPISLAHKITMKLSQVRKDGTLSWAKPDGKSQVTVKYVDGKPTEVTAVVVSIQHDENVSLETITKEIKERVINPICKNYVTADTKYFINATGRFVKGGPEADAGLTGRKIIVDTYGGMGRHGGGAFSGKDPSKVDRSGAYMARHIAKNIVAANLAEKCEVQIAYAIGVAEPVSVYVNTFNTSKFDEEQLGKAVRNVFPLKPARIIGYLKLKQPIYQKTAAFGHFGRDEENFAWEEINKVDELRSALQSEILNTKIIKTPSLKDAVL